MDFFGAGITEWLIVLVVALLFLGPEQLPQAANRLGGMLQQARKSLSETRDAVLQGLAHDEENVKTAASEEHGHKPVDHYGG